MGKRAIVDEDYNPVGARLKRYKEQEEQAKDEPEDTPAAPEQVVAAPPVVSKSVVTEPAAQVVAEQPASREPVREVAREAAESPVLREAPRSVPEEPAAPPRNVTAPTGRLTSKLRVPLSEEEHELWHEFSQRLTGKRNNLACVVRACLFLLEHAGPELERRRPEVSALKRPFTTDHLGRALYEQQLAQFLYDGIRKAGRPPDQLLKRG